jgi:hypothetical protein
MMLLAQILTLYTWGAVCGLLFFLFGIARFFEQRRLEKNSPQKKRFYYPLLLLPAVLFAVSAIIYAFDIYAFDKPLIVGNFWADLLRAIGGLVFVYLGYSLINTMMGGRS